MEVYKCLFFTFFTSNLFLSLTAGVGSTSIPSAISACSLTSHYLLVLRTRTTPETTPIKWPRQVGVAVLILECMSSGHSTSNLLSYHITLIIKK